MAVPYTPARLRTWALPNAVRSVGSIIWQLPKISTFFLLAIVISAVFAGVIAPYDPTRNNLDAINAPPAWLSGGSTAHLLGADQLGRDILSRVIYGARISLMVGIGAVAVASVMGTAAGLLAGYFGRRVDHVISAIVDVWLSIPAILFLLLLALVLGRSMVGLIFGIAILGWANYARIVRGQTFTLKQRDFVALAKIAGCSPWRIMAIHILPNLINSVLVLGTLDMARFIVLESSLSFLGLGVQPPTPAWGIMIAESRARLSIAWWNSVMPGMALVITVLSANSFGDWLRDKLDPIQRAR